MSEETKSEGAATTQREWKPGDVAYARMRVLGHTETFVRALALRDTSESSGYLLYPDELLKPEALVAELAGDIVAERDALRAELDGIERDAARAELEAIRFILNGDAEGLTAKDAAHQFTGVAARVASDLAARTAERDASRAELDGIRSLLVFDPGADGPSTKDVVERLVIESDKERFQLASARRALEIAEAKLRAAPPAAPPAQAPDVALRDALQIAEQMIGRLVVGHLAAGGSVEVRRAR